MSDYPYRWAWRVKHGDRHGQPCRVWARGSMNSIGVEFIDGFRTVTARYAVRKAPQNNASAPLPTAGAARHGRPAPRDRAADAPRAAIYARFDTACRADVHRHRPSGKDEHRSPRLDLHGRVCTTSHSSPQLGGSVND
jgi:hypothetical protein